MKHIGWIVNGTFYPVSESFRVDKIREFRPNVNVVEIYAEDEPCISYN